MRHIVQYMPSPAQQQPDNCSHSCSDNSYEYPDIQWSLHAGPTINMGDSPRKSNRRKRPRCRRSSRATEGPFQHTTRTLPPSTSFLTVSAAMAMMIGTAYIPHVSAQTTVPPTTIPPTTIPPTVTTDDETISACIATMARSDTDRDNYLNQLEYIGFVNALSSQAYANTTLFADLPLPVTTQFDVWADRPEGLDISGSFPGTESLVSEQQQQTLKDICYDTMTVLADLSTPNPSLQPSLAPSNPLPTVPIPVEKTFEECLNLMFLSDIEPIDMKLDQTEYVFFASLMSDNQYEFTDYESLPDILRFNWLILSDTDPVTGIRTIDANGTRPDINLNDLPLEQVEYLLKACDQTETSLNELSLFLAEEVSTAPSMAPGLDLPIPPSSFVDTRVPPTTGSPVTFVPTISAAPSISEAPSRPPILRGSPGPTVSYNDCRVSIAISDANRDNLLNDQEYVQLIYRLSDNPLYRFATFSELPTNLKINFNSLAAQGQTIGQINTYGAFPGQTSTEEEEIFLQQVCQDTTSSIAAVPTPAPVEMPTVSPTRDFSDCLRDIAFSDTSPRNNFLGQQEYTVFVNLLSTGAFWRSSNFQALPRVLRDNFVTLASVERENPDENGNGNAIYVYGAIPQLHLPDAIQFEFLRRVCEDTEAALTEALGQPTEPTAPSTPAPFLPPITTTPAPSTPAPTKGQSLAPALAPIAPTPVPTVAVVPTTPGVTPQPTPRPLTPRPSLPPTRVPTPDPAAPVQTAAPTSDPDEEGGVNVGAIVGGVLGGVAFLCMACIGCFIFSSTILALLACCGFDEDGNRISKVDGNQTDIGDGSDNDGTDGGGFEGFGAPGTPKPGEGAFENIATAASPSGYGGSDDLEAGKYKFDGPPPDTPSKEFGQYGGPDLPMDFGVDLEDLEQFESNSTDESSGSEEMRPSDMQDEDEGASEYSEEASEYSEEASEYTEDQNQEEVDEGGGAFFGGEKGGWGQSDEWGAEQGEEGEESYSEEDDFTQDQEDGFGIDFENDDEEESDDDEEASEYSDEDDQGDIEKKDSPDTYENADVTAFDAFGDDDGGFETDGFGNGFSNEAEDDEDSPESGSESYDDDEESPSQSGSEYDEDLQQADDELESQIEDGDWDGVARSVQSFDQDPDEQSSDDRSEYTEDMTADVDTRARVEELVRKKIPDEIDNIDDMMEQFSGREGDLIQALLAMEGEEDSGSIQDVSQEEQSQYSEEPSQYSGGEEEEEDYSGSRDEEEYSQEEGEEGSYYSDEESGSYSGDEQDEEGSYISGEPSGSVSGDEEGSYYSNEEGEEEGSHYSNEEGEEEGSYYSNEEESYDDGGEEGSSYSDEGSYDD